MFFNRTNDAQNAIVDVTATPARTYPNRQEASAVYEANANRGKEMIGRIIADNKDGKGLYEAHS